MADGKKVIAGSLATALFAAIFFGSPKAKASTPGPDKPGVDPGAEAKAEAAACDFVVANRPLEYLGRTRVEGQTEAAWLAFVAYWRSHPFANAEPTTVDEKAAFARLLQCVAKKLPPGPVAPGGLKPAPAPPAPPAPPPPAPPPPAPAPPPADPDPPVAPVPTPGAYYRIKAGDVLFALTSAAYGTKGGTQENFAAGKLVNNDPYNQRFVRPGIEPNLWGPKGRITFLPDFGTFTQQRNDPVKGSEGQGKEFSVIYFPKKA